MPEEKYSDLAELFKVFGDVTRIKILSLLLNGELSVGDVADGEGKSVYYSLDDDHVSEILSCGIEHISEGDA